MHNVIVTPQGDVAAVIDWEISPLGDPLADLAYFLNSWVRPGDQVLPDARSPSLAPGFPERDELASLYADRTRLDLDPLGVYLLFNQFKSVCILQGRDGPQARTTGLGHADAVAAHRRAIVPA